MQCRCADGRDGWVTLKTPKEEILVVKDGVAGATKSQLLFTSVTSAPSLGCKYKLRKECQSFADPSKNKVADAKESGGCVAGRVFRLNRPPMVIADGKSAGVIRLYIRPVPPTVEEDGCWIDYLDAYDGLPICTSVAEDTAEFNPADEKKADAAKKAVAVAHQADQEKAEKAKNAAAKKKADEEKKAEAEKKALQEEAKLLLEIAKAQMMAAKAHVVAAVEAADRRVKNVEDEARQKDEIFEQRLKLAEENGGLKAEQALREQQEKFHKRELHLLTEKAEFESKFNEDQIADIKSFYHDHDAEFERRLALDRSAIALDQEKEETTRRQSQLQLEHEERTAHVKTQFEHDKSQLQLETEATIIKEQQLRLELETQRVDDGLNAWLRRHFQKTHERLGYQLANDLGIESLNDLDMLSPSDMQAGGTLDGLKLPPIPKRRFVSLVTERHEKAAGKLAFKRHKQQTKVVLAEAEELAAMERSHDMQAISNLEGAKHDLCRQFREVEEEKEALQEGRLCAARVEAMALADLLEDRRAEARRLRSPCLICSKRVLHAHMRGHRALCLEEKIERDVAFLDRSFRTLAAEAAAAEVTRSGGGGPPQSGPRMRWEPVSTSRSPSKGTHRNLSKGKTSRCSFPTESAARLSPRSRLDLQTISVLADAVSPTAAQDNGVVPDIIDLDGTWTLDGFRREKRSRPGGELRNPTGLATPELELSSATRR